MSAKLSEVWLELERVAREEGVVRLGAADLGDEHAAACASIPPRASRGRNRSW
jgi:hypothetical protein